MGKDFEAVWTELQKGLTPGLAIPNWTVLKGYLGDTMLVEEVGEIEVVVKAPKARNLLHVDKANFEIVWKVWPSYKAGQLQRQEMRNMTYYSKYIISILQWLETHPS